MIDPEKDGVDHINIYSKANTELGRTLSNFAFSPIYIEDGFFASIEAYWYWLSVPEDEPLREELRGSFGYEAKKLGRQLRGKDWNEDWEFEVKIKKAIFTKVIETDGLLVAFSESDLPFKHYYVYGGKVVEPKEGKWILEYLEDFRKIVKGQT